MRDPEDDIDDDRVRPADDDEDADSGLEEFVVDSVGAGVGDIDVDLNYLTLDGIDDDSRAGGDPNAPAHAGQTPFAAGEVARALRPGRPLFLIHRSHQHASMLPAVVQEILRSFGDRLHVGVVASMPRMSPPRLRQFLGGTDAVVRIADPECFAREDSLGPAIAAQRGDKPFVGPSTLRYWPYFSAAQPQGQTASWVGQVLEAQREAGATVLLTPGLWADPSAPDQALQQARQHADWARSALAADEHLAVNITLSAAWLSSSALREKLLNELIDIDEQVLHLRVRWPLLVHPYGQLVERTVLDGYAELAEVCADNDKTLILPNTGLTGWLCLAWGAHGFSTGMGSGERAFADTRLIKIKRNGPPPAQAQRVFATPLLHVLEKTVSDRLDALPGITACDCRFCDRMRRLPDSRYDKPLANAHYLRAAAALTAAMARHSDTRRDTARAIVEQASRVRATAARLVPFTGADDARHLPLWSELLD